MLKESDSRSILRLLALWRLANDSGVTVCYHGGETSYTKYLADWGATTAASSPPAVPPEPPP